MHLADTLSYIRLSLRVCVMQRLRTCLPHSADTLSCIKLSLEVCFMQRLGPHVLQSSDTLSYITHTKRMFDKEAGYTLSAFS